MYSHLVTRIFRSCSDGSVALLKSCVQCTILCVQYSHLVTRIFRSCSDGSGPAHILCTVHNIVCTVCILTLLPVFLGPALMGVWPCVRVKGASVRSA